MKPTYKVSVLTLLNDGPPKILETTNCPSAESARSLAGAVLDSLSVNEKNRFAVNIVEER